jgi:hypothetical protein
MKRLDDQEAHHGALMDAVFSLTKAVNSKPPLSTPSKTSVDSNTPIALQKKRSRQIAHEYIEDEREEGEEIEDEYRKKEQDYQRKERDYQNRIRYNDRRLVEQANSIEDSVIAEFQRHEEIVERSRRDSRLNAILAKLRYMKDR